MLAASGRRNPVKGGVEIVDGNLVEPDKARIAPSLLEYVRQQGIEKELQFRQPDLTSGYR